ncbi:hypothetical protein H4R27_000685 [Coemansia aciculifera]|nr:hypothetical protein H4R27_000685 [Coemansia aciculifera]
MSEPAADDPGNAPPAVVGEPNGDTSNAQLTSDKLQVGDVVSEALLIRLGKLEKYEHKLAEVARVYRNLNTARKAVETVLKRLTPVQSIAEVEELEAHLSNLNNKSQYAGEQIGALTELDKANRAKVSELEAQLQVLRNADQERQALVKDLDKLTKERKVVEGQLERSNQKLRLDVKALESAKAELEAKLQVEPAKMDIGTLATQLSAELSTDTPVESQPLRDLLAQLVTKCGVPEGLVPAAEVDNATARVSESHVQEMAQLKDILRKELAASEDRLQTAAAESDKVIADLQLQLTNVPAPTEAASTELTAERVGEIITAALAHKLELVSGDIGVGGDDEAVQAPQAGANQPAETGGSKKKGKKKRKGTGASTLTSAAPSPAAPAPASIPTDTADSDAAVVKATPSEIAQLIALIETVAPAADSSTKAALAEAMEAQHAAAIAELKSQMDHSGKQAQQALDDLQQASDTRVAGLSAEVQAKASRVDELTAELQAAESKTAELTSELQTRTVRVDELTAELEARTGRVEELTAEVRSKSVRVDELTAKLQTTTSNYERLSDELKAAEAKIEAFGDERAKLGQALAKAQGAGVRSEAQQAELRAQMTSLTADFERARSHTDELRASFERATVDCAAAVQRANVAESQLAQTAATVSGLEEHVRAVDADLANSRAQFADKSRALAQAAAQAQELQYALEKERRAARAASEDSAKQATTAHERLAAAQAAADAQREKHQEEVEALRRRLADLDHSHAHASRADRLEAQHAERQAELETMRQNLQRAEDAQTALRVEADRLRDVERDLTAANEHLARVTDERALSEQRWKRVHRDLKEELRRLQREKMTAQIPAPNDERLHDPPQSPSAPRSNSLTLASVSSLLRAATTANASASAIAGRRASARAIPAPIAEVAETPAAAAAAAAAVTDRLLPPHTNNSRAHTRSVSNAASTASASSSSSASDALSNDSNANVNVEYLRNVLFRFFNDKDRRTQLVPVLSTLLRCKTDEIKHIQLLLQK